MADQAPTRAGAPRPAGSTPAAGRPDWTGLSKLAGRSIRHVLPGSGDELVEDLCQEAMVRVMRALRAAEARNLEALTVEVARRTAIDHLRARRRWDALMEPWTDEIGDLADPAAGVAATGDPLMRMRFSVLAFFERQRSGCLELARAYFREQDWLTVAAASGRSPEAVRKQWSRCVAALRAMAKADPDRLWRWTRDPGGDEDAGG